MLKICTRHTILNTFILIIYVNCKRTKLNPYKETTTVKSALNAPDVSVSDFSDHIKEIFDVDGNDTTYEVNINENKITDVNFSLITSPNEIIQRFIGPTTTTKRNKIVAMFENITLPTPNYYTLQHYDPDYNIITKYKLLQNTDVESTRSILTETTENVPTQTKLQTKQQTELIKLQSELQTEPMSRETESMPAKQLIKVKAKNKLKSKARRKPTNDDEDMELMEQRTSKLSCIFCDNVSNKDCNDPGNKLLPLTRCEQLDDKCYFMQTPFGIVDRGCYNPIKNHSTYVCACNLCNSIPIHDLPYAFTDQREWLNNVKELNSGRRLRRSVFSQMACVQCEVNQTIDDAPDTNCLEGKYRVLPSEYCNVDEVCGIKSIRNEGYIWRGCIKYPRYNYLWSFCDNDLCNFDAPVSLFDIK